MSRLRPTDDETASRLPEDPAVQELDTATRSALGTQWELRAKAELRVASVFSVVSQGLFEKGADPAVLTIAARAVSDEVRHSELCRTLAERYLGRPVAWPPPGAVPMPRLAQAPDALRPTLHALAMGCVNETIASAWLEVSLRDAVSPMVRAALRELIADDIHHARLGWAHLASTFVPEAVRGELGGWLPRLLETAALPWTRREKDPHPDGFPEHGVPSRQATLDVVHRTVRGVILPGFEQLGVSTALGVDWADQHFGGAQGAAQTT